jgi:hypothetical protein
VRGDGLPSTTSEKSNKLITLASRNIVSQNSGTVVITLNDLINRFAYHLSNVCSQWKEYYFLQQGAVNYVW